MFPSSSPDPRRVSSRRRAGRIVVRPGQLAEVGHRFALSAGVIMGSCRRLRFATSPVRVNPTDPGLTGLERGTGPLLEMIEGLADEGRRLERVAAELTALGVAAAEADAGTWTDPDVPIIDRVSSAAALPRPFLTDPRTVDRLVGQFSVTVARNLVSGVEVVHDGWEAGGFRWPGDSPSSPGSPPPFPSPAAEGRVFRRRTIGWLGPGRPLEAAGSRDSVTNDNRARGARAVAGAVDLTANGHWIRPDEIGLIHHGDQAFTVVLPGVTDLSRPSTGWNPHHRSVRDLDMAAIDSARSSAVADNRYARVVAEALGRAGVEPGARLMIVGHSYGADTALDLAADPRFNGLRYRVEQVVAAGYYSQPQLRHLQGSTDVLVLQNRRDVVIEVERLGRWAMAPMESLANAVLGAPAIGAGGGSGVTTVRFNGGAVGAGHHPENYRRFVQDLGGRRSRPGNDPMDSWGEVDRFLTRVGAGPWGRGGRLDAVNVSVPR